MEENSEFQDLPSKLLPDCKDNNNSAASTAFVATLRQGFASLGHTIPSAPLESSHISNATAGLPSAASTKTPTWATTHNSILLQLVESDTVALSPYLDTLIHRELQSQIRNVPYTSSRSGASGIIDCLYLRTNITLAASFCSWAQTITTTTATTTKGVVAGIKSPSLLTTANTTTTPAILGSLPAGAPSPCRNLHLKPYLIIYLTSCETLDQYKTKVRPALQLLEKTCNDLNDPFLIIHVPRSKKPTLLANGLFLSPSSLTSSGAAPELAACSAREKEVYKRLQADFTSQRVCMLSTLLQVAAASTTNSTSESTSIKEGKTKEGDTNSTTLPLFQQEWEIVLQKLGSCIFTSFQDRMKLYQEEMKRLNALKISLSKSFQQKKDFSPSSDKKDDALENGNTNVSEKEEAVISTEIDDELSVVNTEYMLVKEGMSFSYEQMRLYREALLHYEELTAWVPEQGLRAASSSKSSSRHTKKVSSESLLIQENAERLVGPVDIDTIIECDATKRQQVWKYASSGDTDGMRSMLEGTPDMAGGEDFSALILHQYIFVRIAQLLFLLKRPVEILRRSYDFVVQLYKMRRTYTSKALSPQDAEVWAISTCWDIKCACEEYFKFSFSQSYRIGASSPHTSKLKKRSEQNIEASCYLGQLLDFSRLRLLTLGDLKFGGPDKNPVRKATAYRPADTLKRWVSWSSLPTIDDEKVTSNISDALENGQVDVTTDRLATFNETSFLSTPFTSFDLFSRKYLEISHLIIYLYQQAGRYRFCSRLLAEQAEIYMSLGEYQRAAAILLEIVDTLSRDGWQGLYLLCLFRLACCQRAMGDTPSYLKTLAKSFHPKFAPLTPPNIKKLFQNDLECLVQGDGTANSDFHPQQKYALGFSPFLELELGVESAGLLGRKSHPLGYLRKKVVRHMCPVGVKICIHVAVLSHLPKEIVLDNARLFLMKSDDFERTYRTTSSLEEKEHYRILNMESSVNIQSGENLVTFEWIPMTVGQYVLSAVELSWGCAQFFHDSASLKKHIQAIDVLPSDPTQTVVLNPLFLIPGETQQIRLAFSSKSDYIREGRVNLECSRGLKILPPNTDENDNNSWVDKCTIPLTPCGLNETQLIKAMVTSDPIQVGEPAQSIHAKISTLYHHALYQDVIDAGEPESPPLSAILFADVTTLGSPALTVHTADAFSLSDGKVIVSVSLLCNTPVPFFIKEWSASFPPPLELLVPSESYDVLVGHAVSEGQEIFFSLTCRIMELCEPEEQESENPSLSVILRDDQGKTFQQVLQLDLSEFYQKIKRDLEFSGKNVAYAELACSHEEGLVGAPVYFTYTVDVRTINMTMRSNTSPPRNSNQSTTDIHSIPPLLYSIICDTRYWILSGKVAGVVPSNLEGSFSIVFVGIPARSGVLKQFPKLKLYFVPSADELNAPTITVHCRVPEAFTSLAFKNQIALAAPAILDSSNYN